MPSCKEITELATSWSEGALDPVAERSFDDHLAACSGCRTWVRQLDVTARAIGSLPPPELPAELRDRLLRGFDAWRAARGAGEAPARAAARPQGGGRHAWEAFFAVVAVVAFLVGIARNPSHALEDWAVASALAAGAIGLAAVARRFTLRFAAAAVSAAFVAAVVRGGSEGRLGFPAGLECLLTVAGAAAAVTGAAWLAARRGRGSVALGAWAVAGALAGDAALQIACGRNESLPHLAAFHAGGVLAVAALAAAVARLRLRTA